MLAKAVAGEAKVPFFSLSGSAFVEMYVGVGASRVRDLFKQAQSMAPCIIFIDEIDAIGKSRDNSMGSNDEREQTLNQLLAEMDGFDTDKGLLLLAATNRPEILDPALLRPGRFDRRIIVDKPDLKGRIDVLKVHAKDVKMDETVDLEAIALATSGAVGSDLANMINEAAINAVKNGRKVVSQADLFEAVEVVLVGKEKKDRIMNVEERKIVSYHEVGHALVSALQKDSEPVQKITIVPRTMGALGYVMHTPEEEKFLNTKKELEAMIVGMLGGRAAEEIVFDTVTTGASNDIEKATKVARAMITQYGMSERFGLMGLESVQNKYLDGRAVLNCGEASALQKDSEPVQKITIVPRTMGALGYVMHTPEEEKFLNTKKELEAMIVGMLGGRAAEEIVFDTVTTGASNDIEKATKVARAMITQYGMSERFGLMGLESVQNKYLDGRAVLNCGEATAAEIDQEVMKMLKAAYEEAKRLLTENREALDKIAAFLIEKETITGKEFMKIFHEVQGIEVEEEESSKEESSGTESVQEEKKEAIAVVEDSEFAESTGDQEKE